jgi:serine/threonine protein kinase
VACFVRKLGYYTEDIRELLVTGGVERQAPVLKMCLACNQEFAGELARCPNDGTALITLSQPDDWVGKIIADRYEVRELLGKGGMGVVYLARHRMMDRWVAVKMLQAELAQDEMSVKRFQQEAQAASCLNHPHLVVLHDYGITPTGQPFLVMEYLQGRSLLEVIKLEGPLSVPRAVKIFSEVADGLHHAHVQGIVHRDIKPSNILLMHCEGDPDFAKVLDFGLAKLMPWSGKESQHLTKTGEVFGSPIYMSPEQCMGKPLLPTSDIYSTGITLFESLTGKPPFRGANSIQTASLHMTEPPPRFTQVRPDLHLPECLEKVVLRALAKEPAERFQSMAEFKDALQGALSGDIRIDIPSSLAVSRAHVPAIDSTNALPSLKAVQDRLKTGSHQAVPAKSPPNVKLIVSICAALLIVLGGAGIFAMNALSKTMIKGVVYQVDGTPGSEQIELMVGNRLQRMRLSPEAYNSLTKWAANQPLREKQWLGLSVTAEERGQVITGLSDYSPDKQIVGPAVEKLNDFLEKLCDKDESDAAKLLSPAAPSALGKFFSIPDMIKLRGAGGSDIGKAMHADQTEPVTEHRDPSAIVLLEVNGRSIAFLVRKDAYQNGATGWWRFDIKHWRDGYWVEGYRNATDRELHIHKL